MTSLGSFMRCLLDYFLVEKYRLFRTGELFHCGVHVHSNLMEILALVKIDTKPSEGILR